MNDINRYFDAQEAKHIELLPYIHSSLNEYMDSNHFWKGEGVIQKLLDMINYRYYIVIVLTIPFYFVWMKHTYLNMSPHVFVSLMIASLAPVLVSVVIAALEAHSWNRFVCSIDIETLSNISNLLSQPIAIKEVNDFALPEHVRDTMIEISGKLCSSEISERGEALEWLLGNSVISLAWNIEMAKIVKEGGLQGFIGQMTKRR